MLDGHRILLIIAGGIAAYKCLELIRLLRKAGAAVTPVLTAAGAEFVTPLSVAALAGEPVHDALFDLTAEAEMGHIELSRSADLVVVAPATADLMARLATGGANDLASTLLLATDKRVLLAPAMNVRMWLHPATQRNLATLAADGRIEWNDERSQPVQSPAIRIGEVAPDSCVVTGAHYFVFPTWYGGRPSKFIEGTCAYCGMQKRQPGWAPRKGGSGARGRWMKQEAVASVADLEPVASESLRPWDAALDAVMHLGGGDIASLNGIAQQLEGTALFTSQFVRALESLAHVAVERDESGHPVRWEISPRSLAERSDGGWELVGFWPPSAVAELVASVEAVDGEIDVKAADDAPTSMSLWDVRLDDLDSIQRQEVVASPTAGTTMLSVLPRLSAVADSLIRMPLPGFDSAERFVASSSSWVSVSHCLDAGAYRIRRGFEVIYQFVTDVDVSNQQAARVSPYLAKYLEANRAGVRLVTYYQDREAIVVPRGAELPGLYGRALVLMTGQLPKPMVLKKGGRERKCLAYEGVSQIDADLLLTLLNT